MKIKMVIAVVLIVALAAGGWFFFKSKGNAVQFKTEQVIRGDLSATVTATGTVSAVTTVLVGTQVSGTVKELLVDYNSPVKKGQLLAQIDPALSEAKVSQARANLQSAEAGVEKAVAVLQDANRTLDRNRTLWDRNYIARSDLDTSETNQQSATAQLSVAKAQVGQARAALQQEETTLQYTRILSPVDGVVISRNVDVGQTVAASFQTPTLFSIAQDLTRMQIDTNVDEADIGRIRVGQTVQFTVDAYPDTLFPGKVAEVRNAPTTIQNVVTYDVVVKVANPELKLKPGMTANVSIITALEKDVLKVPNAAIRFKWQPAGAESDRGSAGGASGAGRAKAGGVANATKTQGVWVLDGKKPRRVPVTLGINDGNNTAVISGELKEGDAAIIEATGQAKKGAPQTGGPRFF
jgi:HlyD family secretion protein